MKRNIIPLLGIAFVVAVLSTGVFYGLFAGKLRSTTSELPGQPIVVAARDLDRGTVLKPDDLRVTQVKGTLKGSFSKADDAVGATLLESVQQNEPLLQTRLASLQPKGNDGSVAAGMRAVSVRISESSGLLSQLHPGSRVDLQAVAERNGSAQLRTILQNVQVLSLNPQPEPGNNRQPVPVVSVLVPAQDADAVALADSAARIRVTLRNPLDEATAPRHAVPLSAIFQSTNSSNPAAQSADKKIAVPAAGSAALGSPDSSIELRVQVLGASAAALRELDSNLRSPGGSDSLGVAPFRAEADAQSLVQNLERNHELEVVSRSKLTTSLGRPAHLRAGKEPYRLRVQFIPAEGSGGKLSLRVAPEISVRGGQGVETRRYDANLPDDGSFLVRGLLRDQGDAHILERLFPGHAWNGRQLVIFVSSKVRKPVPGSAYAAANRGQ